MLFLLMNGKTKNRKYGKNNFIWSKNMKKRLGLDTSFFRKLREKDLVYMDKTKWIYKLITEGECYFLSRPRRFGKFVTVSPLKEFF